MVKQLKSHFDLILMLPQMGDIKTELEEIEKVIKEYKIKIGVG